MSATSAPDPSTPVKPRPALPWRWLERFSAYKQWTGPLLVLVLLGLGLIGCRYLLQDIDPNALHQAIVDIPGHALMGAVLATAVGFVALIGYEWSACRYAGADLRWR